jgi:hypothetical protein
MIVGATTLPFILAAAGTPVYSEGDFAALSAPSQLIVRDQQQLTVRLIWILPYVSIMLALLGSGFLIFGLARWYPKQEEEDRNRKNEHHLTQLTVTEQIAKLFNAQSHSGTDSDKENVLAENLEEVHERLSQVPQYEITNAQHDETERPCDDRVGHRHEQEPQAQHPSGDFLESPSRHVARAFLNEFAIINVIRELATVAFDNPIEIFDNVIVRDQSGNTLEIDVVIQREAGNDIILEIKQLREVDRRMLSASIVRAGLGARVYTAETRRAADAYLLVILPETAMPIDHMDGNVIYLNSSHLREDATIALRRLLQR